MPYAGRIGTCSDNSPVAQSALKRSVIEISDLETGTRISDARRLC